MLISCALRITCVKGIADYKNIAIILFALEQEIVIAFACAQTSIYRFYIIYSSALVIAISVFYF